MKVGHWILAIVIAIVVMLGVKSTRADHPEGWLVVATITGQDGGQAVFASTDEWATREECEAHVEELVNNAMGYLVLRGVHVVSANGKCITRLSLKALTDAYEARKKEGTI